MRKRLIFAILIMGLSGIVAQVLLLRELLVSFFGNELTIGIILGNWLLLEAAGAFFLGKTIEVLKRKLEALIALQIAFAISFPVSIYFARVVKNFIGATGEGVGLLPIFFSSLLILMPVSLSHGALFTFFCRLYALEKVSGEKAIGQVYVHETAGTITGGVLFTYIFLPYFHAFEMAFCIGLLNIIACLLLLKQKRLLFLAIIFLFLILDAKRWHLLSIKKQWRDQEVVFYQNSIYSNIVVTKRGGQYTFFSDGIPAITTPVPDIDFVETFVHLSLLSHPQPKKALIVGGGAGGPICEILRHSIKELDYAELDPLIIEAVRGFPTPLTVSELSDPRVRIKYLDGRLFLKQTREKYDLILIGLCEPSDLQVNRLFTREFFLLSREKLEQNGILVLSLPGTMVYLNEELAKLNACILVTLNSVFPYVKVIPGEFNLFLGSASDEVISITPFLLEKRLKNRGISTNLITEAYLSYKLGKRWEEWFFASLERYRPKGINEDFKPIAVFYSLDYWHALFSPYMKRLFKLFEGINLAILSLVSFPAVLAFLLYRKRAIFAIPFAIATTGFCGMVFDLVLIYGFQILYGYVYSWIGLLVTSFMLGAAVGALKMTNILEKIKREKGLFMGIEVAIGLFSLLLSLCFFRSYISGFFPSILFLFLSFLSGLLIGVEFPLASKFYLKYSPSLGKTAGLLYAADLLGGWLGGIIAGVLLLPFLGLSQSCLFLCILKGVSLTLIALTK